VGNNDEDGGNGVYDGGKQDHEVYCASGNRRRYFFVTEGGKLAKSLLSLKTFRRRFILPKILFKYGGEERTGECLSRQNTHEEEEVVEEI
jgi:hypothetical protein